MRDHQLSMPGFQLLVPAPCTTACVAWEQLCAFRMHLAQAENAHFHLRARQETGKVTCEAVSMVSWSLCLTEKSLGAASPLCSRQPGGSGSFGSWSPLSRWPSGSIPQKCCKSRQRREAKIHDWVISHLSHGIFFFFFNKSTCLRNTQYSFTHKHTGEEVQEGCRK